MWAAADEVDEAVAQRWAAAQAGSDDRAGYVAMVGLVALGRFTASPGVLDLLRERATDGSWRIREAVAMALQRLGDDQPDELGRIAREWSSSGDPLVARAAVAAVAEPRLLRSAAPVDAALDVMDSATKLVVDAANGRAEPVRVLRQALGYAWSVVIAADQAKAWPHFVAWAASHPDDADAQWIVRENLKKYRLVRLGLTL